MKSCRYLGSLFPSLKWLGNILIGGFLFGWFGTYIFDALKHGESPDPRRFLIYFYPYRPIILAAGGSFLLLFLLSWLCRRRTMAQGQFHLWKPAAELNPADFGFTPRQPGEKPQPGERPFYDCYIPRSILPEDSPSAEPEPETALRDSLGKGRGFILIGPPLDGKTRTLYQVVKSLEPRRFLKPQRWWVLRPRSDCSVPGAGALSVLNGKNVILLLDDLQDYVGATCDLGALHEDASKRARCLVIAATCREGPELDSIRQGARPVLQRVLEDIPVKRTLVRPTEEEKSRLAKSVGQDLEKALEWPHLGMIPVSEPLSAMRERWKRLELPEKRTLQAMLLLAHTGIGPFTHCRVQLVLDGVFGAPLEGLNFQRTLEALANQGFIARPAGQDPALPEPAYLAYVVQLDPVRDLASDLASLGKALAEIEDAEALFSLGVTYGVGRQDPAKALEAFQEAIRLKPGYAEAHNNKGVVLSKLNRWEEALEAFEEAIRLKPGYADAHYNKGVALGKLNQWEEALEAYEEVIRLKPGYAEAYLSKGAALGKLNRPKEALEAFQEAIRLKPGYTEAHYGKGVALGKLNQWKEALEAYERAIRLKPGAAEAYPAKGEALGKLNRWEEALEAFEEALRLEPDLSPAALGAAIALFELGRTKEAFTRACAVWRHRDELRAPMQQELANLFNRLGRDPEACDSP